MQSRKSKWKYKPLKATTNLELNDTTFYFLRYANSVGARHYETSAKVNSGIEELFLDLTNQMIEVRDRKLAAEALQRSNSLRRGNTLRLEGENDDMDDILMSPDTRSSSKCCGTG